MLQTLLKNLDAMPYSEMMVLARYLEKQMPGCNLTSELVASVLSEAKAGLSENKTEQQEQKILLQVFSRKRTINIKKFNTGYAIEVPTLPGSTVTGTDLRAMLGQMLDQIVTVEVLGGGSTRARG